MECRKGRGVFFSSHAFAGGVTLKFEERITNPGNVCWHQMEKNTMRKETLAIRALSFMLSNQVTLELLN